MSSAIRQIKHITVLGGGLTGLTSAYRLAQLVKSSSQRGNVSSILHPEAKITLLEHSSRVGGWVQSRRRSIDLPDGVKDDLNVTGKIDVVLESGPRSIRPRGSKGAAQMLKLVCERVQLRAVLARKIVSHMGVLLFICMLQSLATRPWPVECDLARRD